MNHSELKELLIKHANIFNGNIEFAETINNKLDSKSISSYNFNSTLNGIVLNATQFNCCIFNNVDFAGALINANFFCCQFINCRFYKTQFYLSSFNNTSINDSNFIRAEIRSTNFHTTCFVNCDFGLCDLVDIELEQSSIEGIYKSDALKPLIREVKCENSILQINLHEV